MDKNIEKLIKLVQENPELEVIPWSDKLMKLTKRDLEANGIQLFENKENEDFSKEIREIICIQVGLP